MGTAIPRLRISSQGRSHQAGRRRCNDEVQQGQKRDLYQLCNEGDKSIKINAGDGVIQMIFVPFGITYNDESTGVRDGGFGSTGA